MILISRELTFYSFIITKRETRFGKYVAVRKKIIRSIDKFYQYINYRIEMSYTNFELRFYDARSVHCMNVNTRK